MIILIFIAALIFWPVTLLLIRLGDAILSSLTFMGCAPIFLAWLTLTKARWFLTTQPAHIVIPGALAWAGSIILWLFWLDGHYF